MTESQISHGPEAVPDELPVTRRSYWQTVWRQFRRHKPAVVGLCLVVLLFLMSILAPLLANKYPYYWYSKSEGWTFPLFRALTNMDLTLFASLILFLLIPVTRRLLRRSGWTFWQLNDLRRAVAVNLLALLLFAAAMKNFAFTSVDLPPFRELTAFRIGLLLLPVAIVVGVVLHKILAAVVRGRMSAYTGLLAWGVALGGYAVAVVALMLSRMDPIPVPVFVALPRSQLLWSLVILIMVAVPVTVVLLRRTGLRGSRRLVVAVSGHGYVALLTVLLLTNCRVVPDRVFEEKTFTVDGRSQTFRIERDYRKEIAEGTEASYLLPPIPYAPTDTSVGEKYETPNAGHILGTDRLGRSNASRIVYGARIGLAVGFIAVGISTAIGILIGGISAYFGGWVDLVLQRLVEVFICFPTFFLLLTIIAFWGPKLWYIMIAIGLTSWTGTARLIRSGVLQAKNLDYITAARASGLSSLYIILRHALPNTIAPVLVGATFGVAGAITLEASLSFLSLGDPDYPSWGLLLQHARAVAGEKPSLVVVAGTIIFLAVLAYNLVGEGLRDAIDPRLKEV
ncbi:MAG: ABC transporter permease [Planctomycetes bacterium]|nr:ABC transporter permease [Planctomycetota bacterium]